MHLIPLIVYVLSFIGWHVNLQSDIRIAKILK